MVSNSPHPPSEEDFTVLLFLHSPEMLQSGGRVGSNGSWLFLHRESLWPSCHLLRSVSHVTRTAEASSSRGHIWSSGFVNCAWDQMASSSSAEGPIEGTPSWMVIPWVLLVVGSLLPLNVYLREGKTSGLRRSHLGFLQGLASPHLRTAARIPAGSKPTCAARSCVHVRPPRSRRVPLRLGNSATAVR